MSRTGKNARQYQQCLSTEIRFLFHASHCVFSTSVTFLKFLFFLCVNVHKWFELQQDFIAFDNLVTVTPHTFLSCTP